LKVAESQKPEASSVGSGFQNPPTGGELKNDERTNPAQQDSKPPFTGEAILSTEQTKISQRAEIKSLKTRQLPGGNICSN